MKILVTGASGFVGKNLTAELKNISEGKKTAQKQLQNLTVLCADIDTPADELSGYCAECNFVYHLAGVNRPQSEGEFQTGNLGSLQTVTELLRQHKNTCPVMLSSSTQAELDNPYGKSKLCAENILRDYGEQTGAKVYIYRFPGVFGKWCRPNYNSVVATFCHNIAHGLPINIDDPGKSIRLVYIDDVVRSLILCLMGRTVPGADGFCRVMPEFDVKLMNLSNLLYGFRNSREGLSVADMSDGFTKRLYATYLSYLPTGEFCYPLLSHCDNRGSFTEIIRTPDRGQFSVNISKPHIVKGNHWHNTKNEKFCVVSGRGVIRFRQIDSDEVTEYFVSSDKIEVVDIPPGYTHNIENLGDTDMVTFMWCCESFDPDNPDTYFLEV